MRESNIKRVKNYPKREQVQNIIISSKSAHARERTQKPFFGKGCTCSYREAGDAALEIIYRVFASKPYVRTKDNFRLWSWYCRHYDRNVIITMADKKMGYENAHEIANAVTAFQRWLTKTYGEKPSCI